MAKESHEEIETQVRDALVASGRDISTIESICIFDFDGTLVWTPDAAEGKKVGWI